jgi:metal-responsive CopG/Arc/MetJ family transcriptional regulator
METHERNYTTVSIPKDLAEKIEEILPKSGYLGIADFVRDAVRRRLEQMEAS